MADSTSPTFFSYSRQDGAFALRLARDLKSRGAAIWLDQLDIEPGDHWDTAVESALTRCPRVVVILSQASTNSQNVMDEISYAFDEGKAVIPVLHEDCKVPFRLRRLQYADFRTDYAAGLVQLEEALKVEPKPAAHPEPEPPAAIPTDSSRARRWLLLRSPKSTGGKVARIAFYLLLVVFALFVLGIFINDNGSFDIKAPARDPGGTFGGFVLMVVLLAGFWYWALRASADKPAPKREKSNAARSSG